MYGARGEGKQLHRVLRLAALLFCVGVGCHSALAVQSIRVPIDADAIDLTKAVEPHSAQGDRIQVSTAPGADGIVRRIEVSALEAGAQPSWIVFALTNDSDEQLSAPAWCGPTSARAASRRSRRAKATRPNATTGWTPTCSA
jgi:hypothetical protein